MIRATPVSERPRERCLIQGASCLSLREVLALVLNSGPRGIGALGLATTVLEKTGPGMEVSEQEHAFFSGMELSPSAHLGEIHGLGPAGQARIMAAFELGRRYALYKKGTRSRRSDSGAPSVSRLARIAVSRIRAELREDPKEWIGFVPLYSSGRIGQLCIVEKGVRTHVNVDPIELFARILALRPTGILLFHNHPSGSLEPSPEDRELTRRVRDLARPLGIQLIGHGIITSTGEGWIGV